HVAREAGVVPGESRAGDGEAASTEQAAATVFELAVGDGDAAALAQQRDAFGAAYSRAGDTDIRGLDHDPAVRVELAALDRNLGVAVDGRLRFEHAAVHDGDAFGANGPGCRKVGVPHAADGQIDEFDRDIGVARQERRLIVTIQRNLAAAVDLNRA